MKSGTISLTNVVILSLYCSDVGCVGRLGRASRVLREIGHRRSSPPQSSIAVRNRIIGNIVPLDFIFRVRYCVRRMLLFKTLPSQVTPPSVSKGVRIYNWGLSSLCVNQRQDYRRFLLPSSRRDGRRLTKEQQQQHQHQQQQQCARKLVTFSDNMDTVIRITTRLNCALNRRYNTVSTSKIGHNLVKTINSPILNIQAHFISTTSRFCSVNFDRNTGTFVKGTKTTETRPAIPDPRGRRKKDRVSNEWKAIFR